MRMIPRVITSTLFFAIGTGIIFFSISALLKTSDWVMITIHTPVVIVGLAFGAIGWTAARSEDIKEMLQDLFSSISF